MYNMRWWMVMVTALALGACASESAEDGLPDALPEADDADDQPLQREESRNVRPRAYQQAAYNALPTGFRSTAAPSLAELAGYSRPAAAAAYTEQRGPPQQRQPQHQHQQQQQQQQQQHQHQHQHQQQQQQRPAANAEELEEEEREEPDRLTELLQQSRFECAGKQTGYYADQELNCEVFHYCQDSLKHSWICPDGFTFHQVHLICMPPTHDNICQKSAKYHFVNEYLYRPINEEEVQRKPNVSLKYSDRYFPSEVYHDDRYDVEEDEDEEEPRRAPVHPTHVQQQHQHQHQQPQQPQQPQVFRSAEEVNIPLVHRRPQRPYEFDF